MCGFEVLREDESGTVLGMFLSAPLILSPPPFPARVDVDNKLCVKCDSISESMDSDEICNAVINQDTAHELGCIGIPIVADTAYS